MKSIALNAALGLMGLSVFAQSASAFRFETGDINGSFDSTVSIGTGIRTRNPSANLVVQGNSGGPEGQASLASGINDQSDLNYKAGRPYTTYVKGIHELLVNLPSDITFMSRATWLKDFSATRTSGYIGGASAGVSDLQDGLTADSRKEMRFKTRLLDLWIAKKFEIGSQRAQIRLGNQVVNWGESLFIAGGLNATNAVDIQRFSLPGTQIKEALLPAPMLNFSTTLGGGFSAELFAARKWVDNYFSPVGSYWSITSLGRGMESYGLVSVKPKDRGQWGASLKYEPPGTSLNIGAYALTINDHTPLFTYDAYQDGSFQPGFRFAEKRRIYGLSANMPVGEWAVGTELSYRPNDTLPLHAGTGSFCMDRGGNCWTEGKRFQWHLTGMQSLTPSNSRDFLDAIGAQGGTVLAELVVIKYPGMRSRLLPGELLAAGEWAWGQEFDGSAAAVEKATSTSTGLAMDLSVTYDNTLIQGWQVTPEIYYTAALSGYTPNGTFLRGAQAATLTTTFVSSPSRWQLGVSYSKFWGGSSIYSQPMKDRDTVGAYAAINF